MTGVDLDPVTDPQSEKRGLLRLVRPHSDEGFDLTAEEWANALLLAEDHGWVPVHQRLFYFAGGLTVSAEDASSMAASWERLFERAAKTPVGVYPLRVNLDRLYLLMEFVNAGAFDVGAIH